MEKTLVLIKPDGVQRGLVGPIISRLEGCGLKLIAMKLLQLDRALAEELYAIHQGKNFFPGLMDYITSSPLVSLVVEGKNAINVVRKTIGETDPGKAGAGTIGGDYALETGRNLVHASDSSENAAREINLFFQGKELLNYRRETDKWITES
ncbi:nucleoside-diphosphate kinase [Chloroflexota bacterium]